MSSKYKKKTRGQKPRKQKPTPQGQTSRRISVLDQAAIVAGRSLAEDGYSNAAASLGDASVLLSSGTFLRSNLTANTELLTAAYRESWLAKRIIDMPSEDMTRKWYKLNTSMDDQDLRRLKRLEAKHNVRQEITNAIRWARLYGGSLAVMVLRDGMELSEPLDLEGLSPGAFQGLLVLDRTQGISPSTELETNLDDPDFGEPMWYDADIDTEEERHVRIHHSRVLKFTGRELPRLEMQAEMYWGVSELEHIWDELKKRDAASANIAQLLFQANVTTLKMGKFGEALVTGSDNMRSQILGMLQLENRYRTSFGTQLLSKDDQVETHPYAFTGISDVYENFMMDMAGASEIPATKLFGRSPQGMNANGISDLKNYAEFISGLQERMLRPALEKLMPVMAYSCWGFCPDDFDIVFESIIEPSPSEKAELIDKLSEGVVAAFQCGLITREEGRAEMKARGEAYGVWGKLPSAVFDEMEEETETDDLLRNKTV